MRLCRFGNDRLGVVEGETIRDITAALDVLPAYRYPLPQHDVLVANLGKVVARAKDILPGAPAVPLAGVKLLSPVANPGKIIAAPVNYQKHLDEVKGDSQIHAGNPAHTVTIQSAGLFLKATSSLAGAGDGIAVIKPDRRTDHEVELVVVIGRPGRDISRAEALGHVAGYCIVNDVSERAFQMATSQWDKGKGFDTAGPIGPWLVTTDEIRDPQALDMRLDLNGKRMQSGNTRTMVFNVARIVSHVSHYMTLLPGDIIATGTPPGVGLGIKPTPIFLKPGDVMRVAIQGLGEQRQRVVPYA